MTAARLTAPLAHTHCRANATEPSTLCFALNLGSKVGCTAAAVEHANVVFQPARLRPTLAFPGHRVGAQPVYPEASRPCIGIEHTHGKDTPLLCLPCRVEPKGLGEHAKDARAPSPGCALVLRKPHRDDAAKGDANLIYAHELLFCAAHLRGRWHHSLCSVPLLLTLCAIIVRGGLPLPFEEMPI